MMNFTYKKSSRKMKKGLTAKSPVNLEVKDWDFLSYKNQGHPNDFTNNSDAESRKKPHSNRIKAH